MKIINAIKKLEKSGYVVGVKSKVHYIATNNSRIIKFVDNGSGEITSIETGNVFFDNLTQAMS